MRGLKYIAAWLALAGFAVADIPQPVVVDFANNYAPNLEVYQANEKTYQWTIKMVGTAQNISNYDGIMYWATDNGAASIVTATCVKVLSGTSGIFNANFSASDLNTNGTFMYGVGIYSNGTTIARQGTFTITADPFSTGAGALTNTWPLNGSLYGPFTGDFSNWPFYIKTNSDLVSNMVVGLNSRYLVTSGIVDHVSNRVDLLTGTQNTHNAWLTLMDASQAVTRVIANGAASTGAILTAQYATSSNLLDLTTASNASAIAGVLAASNRADLISVSNASAVAGVLAVSGRVDLVAASNASAIAGALAASNVAAGAVAGVLAISNNYGVSSNLLDLVVASNASVNAGVLALSNNFGTVSGVVTLTVASNASAIAGVTANSNRIFVVSNYVGTATSAVVVVISASNEALRIDITNDFTGKIAYSNNTDYVHATRTNEFLHSGDTNGAVWGSGQYPLAVLTNQTTVKIGPATTIGTTALAVGDTLTSGRNSLIVGNNSLCGSNSLAIGSAISIGNRSVGIGNSCISVFDDEFLWGASPVSHGSFTATFGATQIWANTAKVVITNDPFALNFLGPVAHGGTNIISALDAKVDVAGDTMTDELHIPPGTASNSAVTRKQLYDAIDDIAGELTLYGATNAHPTMTVDGSLWRTSPNTAWALTNVLNAGTNVIGVYWLTNTINRVRNGNYIGRFYAVESGPGSAQAKIDLVRSLDDGATTNLLAESALSGTIGGSLTSYRLVCASDNDYTNANQWLGVRYLLVRSAVGASTVVTYGGDPYPTHIETPGLGDVTGYLTAESDPKWLAVSNNVVQTNDASDIRLEGGFALGITNVAASLGVISGRTDSAISGVVAASGRVDLVSVSNASAIAGVLAASGRVDLVAASNASAVAGVVAASGRVDTIKTYTNTISWADPAPTTGVVPICPLWGTNAIVIFGGAMGQGLAAGVGHVWVDVGRCTNPTQPFVVSTNSVLISTTNASHVMTLGQMPDMWFAINITNIATVTSNFYFHAGRVRK